jgi:hypothetical protein
MASISAIDESGHVIKRGSKARADRYRVRYRTPAGASRSKTFDQKIHASAFLTTIEHRKTTGEYVDPAVGRVTFKIHSAAWLDRKRSTTRPTTVETFTSHLNKHLIPRFASVELRSITREDVKAFAGEQKPGVAPDRPRGLTARSEIWAVARQPFIPRDRPMIACGPRLYGRLARRCRPWALDITSIG